MKFSRINKQPSTSGTPIASGNRDTGWHPIESVTHVHKLPPRVRKSQNLVAILEILHSHGFGSGFSVRRTGLPKKGEKKNRKITLAKTKWRKRQIWFYQLKIRHIRHFASLRLDSGSGYLSVCLFVCVAAQCANSLIFCVLRALLGVGEFFLHARCMMASCCNRKGAYILIHGVFFNLFVYHGVLFVDKQWKLRHYLFNVYVDSSVIVGAESSFGKENKCEIKVRG